MAVALAREAAWRAAGRDSPSLLELIAPRRLTEFFTGLEHCGIKCKHLFKLVLEVAQSTER